MPKKKKQPGFSSKPVTVVNMRNIIIANKNPGQSDRTKYEGEHGTIHSSTYQQLVDFFQDNYESYEDFTAKNKIKNDQQTFFQDLEYKKPRSNDGDGLDHKHNDDGDGGDDNKDDDERDDDSDVKSFYMCSDDPRWQQDSDDEQDDPVSAQAEPSDQGSAQRRHVDVVWVNNDQMPVVTVDGKRVRITAMVTIGIYEGDWYAQVVRSGFIGTRLQQRDAWMPEFTEWFNDLESNDGMKIAAKKWVCSTDRVFKNWRHPIKSDFVAHATSEGWFHNAGYVNARDLEEGCSIRI